MRLSRLTGALALGAVAALAACSDSSVPVAPDDLDPSYAVAPQVSVDVIVILNEGFAARSHSGNQVAAAAIARSLGIAPTQTYGTAVFGFAGSVPEGRLNALARDPRVAYVERDQIVSIVPAAKPGGGTTQPPQSIPWGIVRVGGAGDGAGKTAWVIDTGIDLDHPDLSVDVARSRDFTGSRVGPDDENGHGTHVAGTIAAKNNTIGVIGVAAGANVVAVRVLNKRGSGTWSGVIAGVDYVAANGGVGDAANMSLSGGYSETVNAAVMNAAGKGIKFSLAAGNESTSATTRSPASANHANIYTISAFSSGDLWASFSNYGNPPVDFGAPGVSVYSTYKGGGYATLSGTSMAAPHVAGILLLGNVASSGTVKGDPDGTPDPIAHR